ncbi:hypothetical protein SLEP1_g58357 [Rubroshorea leprosula]|uniref:Uncharacterized protein n=1 Tax=Rubroshorea leprosula TaxID=152421 RepID=A0AAV5MTL6_9ROSI|nr:hypothetical protein SLEP1_g58357 [Rubroshorea leprosula]
MKEIWHGDDVKDGIVFTKLVSLQLKVLPKLESSCSGNCNFEFPSLADVIVMECPSIWTFSKGESGDDVEEDWFDALHKLGVINPLRVIYREDSWGLYCKGSGDDAEEDWSDALHKLFD